MDETIIEHIDGVPLIRIRPAIWGKPQLPIKEKRPIWTHDEITKMLQIIKEKNILSLLYGGKYRKSDVFKVVAANLRKMGYIRTSEQISTKWKHLRLTYAHTKAELKSNQIDVGAKQECAYYDQMDELLGDKIHIVGVDVPEESVQKKEDAEATTFVDFQNSETMDPVITDEVQYEISETIDFNPVEFTEVEVIHTDANETDFSVPGPSGQEETVLIEMEEPHQDPSEFPHDIDSETTVIETSPPKKAKKRKMFRPPPGRLRKSNEGTYSNALKNFTKEWEMMMMRVADKERDQERLEREREKMEQQKWEEQLIEAQSEALTKANVEFLAGLRGLFDELKK